VVLVVLGQVVLADKRPNGWPRQLRSRDSIVLYFLFFPGFSLSRGQSLRQVLRTGCTKTFVPVVASSFGEKTFGLPPYGLPSLLLPRFEFHCQERQKTITPGTGQPLTHSRKNTQTMDILTLTIDQAIDYRRYSIGMMRWEWQHGTS